MNTPYIVSSTVINIKYRAIIKSCKLLIKRKRFFKQTFKNKILVITSPLI